MRFVGDVAAPHRAVVAGKVVIREAEIFGLDVPRNTRARRSPKIELGQPEIGSQIDKIV